jgi:predicted acetylornithine/succinylornithine family transaminase
MIDKPADQARLLEIAQRVFTTNYKPQPTVLRRGAGCTVWDVAGNKLVDLTGGIAACPLGHSHPVLATAIAEQALKLIHVSNLYFNEEQILLADRLTKLAEALGSPRVFFCNSGGEANEAAVKIAKRWQTMVRGKPERIEVLSFEGSFHGRTIATVALTGQEKYRAGFGPLVEWARFVPFPEGEKDSRALDAISERTCAVIIEPIQAEGGIRLPPTGFLQKLRERCSETGTVLIFDEVQTGIGRTGTWFGFQQEGVVPDVISLAKGLGGGVPIGAIVASGELAQAFVPGSHASTFGGNPLACHAARTVLEVIERDRLLERVVAAGDHLDRALSALMKRHSRIKEIRGRGLLRGALLDGDASPIVLKARERGVLLSVAGGTVVRFAPPYVVKDEELDAGVAALDAALSS